MSLAVPYPGAMDEPITLYRFRVRHELTGRVYVLSYHMTDTEARERFGDRIVERLDATKEVRYPQEYRGHYPRG
jgi:hypothetical protein